MGWKCRLHEESLASYQAVLEHLQNKHPDFLQRQIVHRQEGCGLLEGKDCICRATPQDDWISKQKETP